MIHNQIGDVARQAGEASERAQISRLKAIALLRECSIRLQAREDAQAAGRQDHD